MTFNFSLRLDPTTHQCDIVFGVGDVHQHIRIPNDPPVAAAAQVQQEVPIQPQPEVEKKDEEVAKAQFEQFCQGDIAVQNNIASIQKEKEVIVIEDDSTESEKLLKKYTDEIVKELKENPLSFEMQESQLDEVIEAVTVAESLVDGKDLPLFNALWKSVVSSYEAINGKGTDVLTIAAKQQVLEKLDQYVKAIRDLSQVEKEKEVAAVVSEEEKIESPVQIEEKEEAPLLDEERTVVEEEYVPQQIDNEAVNPAEEQRLKELQDAKQKEERISSLRERSAQLAQGVDRLNRDLLWTLLVLDDEGQKSELSQLQGPCPQVISNILGFLKELEGEERDLVVAEFSNAVAHVAR